MESKSENLALLECYGCLAVGGYDFFGVPTCCPNCGSCEVWGITQEKEGK